MNRTTDGLTRREILKTASLASLAAAFPGGLWAAGASEKIRVGLIGCGGRGTGAAINCATASTDVVIAALGDVFPDQLQWSLGQLREKLAADRVAATPETCFTGFDAYKKVLAAGVDLVILAAPPAFRPEHLRAAVEAGKHIFMREAGGRGPAGVRSRDRQRRYGGAEGACHRRRHATASPGPLRRDHEARSRWRHRRDRRGPVLLEHGFPLGRACGAELGRPDRRNWSDMEWQVRNWLFTVWC